MKKIRVITIQKPTGEQTLEVGAKLLGEDEKPMDVTVKKITVFFKTARVYFSDDKMLVFKGFPLIITKK